MLRRPVSGAYEQVVQHGADGYRDVEGVLLAELGDFKAAVEQGQDLLVEAGHFVAKEKDGALPRIRPEGGEHFGGVRLLDAQQQHAPGFGLHQKGRGVINVTPGHGFVGAQCCFGNLGPRGHRRVAGKVEVPAAEGVAVTESGPDIIHAPDVVQPHGSLLELGGRGSLLVFGQNFPRRSFLVGMHLLMLNPNGIKKKLIFAQIRASCSSSVMMPEIILASGSLSTIAEGECPWLKKPPCPSDSGQGGFFSDRHRPDRTIHKLYIICNLKPSHQQ